MEPAWKRPCGGSVRRQPGGRRQGLPHGKGSGLGMIIALLTLVLFVLIVAWDSTVEKDHRDN